MSQNQNRLTGKIAVVTGAGRGMGREIALTLAREGAAVAIGDIDEAGARAAANEIAEETGAKTLGIRCDVVVRAQVDAFVAAAAVKFGRFDVMVANAGIAIGGTRALDASEEDWDRTMDINGKGVVFSNQSAARLPRLPVLDWRVLRRSGWLATGRHRSLRRQ